MRNPRSKNNLDKMLPFGKKLRMQEEWRKVVNFEEYSISSLGRVSRNGKLITTFLVDGYPSFNAVDKNRRKSLRVHREVLRAFVAIMDGKHARHKDGDRLNCSLGNLEWGTPTENEHDKRRHGRVATGDRNGSRRHPERLVRGEASPISKLTESQVIEIRDLAFAGVPKRQIASRFKISLRYAYQIVNLETWRHV